MRQGILITRGAIIESGPETRWSIALSVEASVIEVVGLMSRFGLYCELEEGSTVLRLLPLHFQAPPTAQCIAEFYQGAPAQSPAASQVRFHAG